MEIIEYKIYEENHRQIIDNLKTEEMVNQMIQLRDGNEKFYKLLLSNIGLYYTQIEARCKARRTEGYFINKSLYGMRKDLINIINKNQRKALLQKIPIFKSNCLEYYCSKDTYNCFNLVEHMPELSETNHFKDIMDSIRSQINEETYNKLSILIFGLINISQVPANDPPKMPYINLTDLKVLREKYIIDIKYKESVAYKKLSAEEKLLKDADTCKITDAIEAFYNQTIITLRKFENVLGNSIILLTTKRFNSFKVEKDDIQFKYNKLVDFIDVLEEVNSTSILGTVDFLHAMKNTLNTDNTCKIFEDIDNTKMQSLTSYENIITKKTLSDDLKHPAIGGSKIIGGSLKKQQLIKEYKKLIKEYLHK
jgi:predicted RNA binding protein with dsRBD fold (UPF0201 family)